MWPAPRGHAQTAADSQCRSTVRYQYLIDCQTGVFPADVPDGRRALTGHCIAISSSGYFCAISGTALTFDMRHLIQCRIRIGVFFYTLVSMLKSLTCYFFRLKLTD